MSRYNKNRDSDDEEEGVSGLAIAVGVAAGIAALGGAAFGIKKLYDHNKEEQERPKPFTHHTSRPSSQSQREVSSSGLEKWLGNLGCDDDPRGVGGVMSERSVIIKSGKLTSTTMSLAEDLNLYYQDYVSIDPYQMERAKEVVSDIKDAILLYFHEKLPRFIDELEDSGSAAEGLKVVSPDEFDIMIPLCVDTSCLSLRSNRCVPGFYILEKHASMPSTNANILDEFIEDDLDSGMSYLSPKKLRKFFQSKMQMAINRISEYDIKSGNKGPSIMLEVTYDGYRRTSIDFVPVLKVDDKQVVAKPHPEFLQKGDQLYEKYWRESFSMKERRIITSMSPTACHKKCLKIIKAVRLNHQSQFGMLSSYVYKTLLLQMLIDKDKEEHWREYCLEDRFMEFLDLLHSCLEKGHLPHRFNPAVNLLEPFGHQSLKDIMYYLAKIIKKKSYATLLSKREVAKY